MGNMLKCMDSSNSIVRSCAGMFEKLACIKLKVHSNLVRAMENCLL